MQNIIGKKFGYWKVKKYDKKGYYICCCQCGTRKSVRRDGLLNGRTKSCGCLQKQLARQKRLKPNGEAYINNKYAQYRVNARHKSHSFNVSREEFEKITRHPCFYCGKSPKKYINGLDRVDNTKGYSKRNVVSCCWNCNFAKRKMTLKEFEYWIECVYTCLKRRKKWRKAKLSKKN